MSNEKAKASSGFGKKGWGMILFAALVYFVVTCLTSVYQMAVNFWGPAYGWDATTLLSVMSIGSFVQLALAFFFGKLATKVSAKKISLLLATVFLVAVGLAGFVTEQWQMCVIIVLTVAFGPCWIYNILPIFIANWFPKKKGLVMGIATIGIPLASGLTSRIFAISQGILGLKFAFMPYFVLGIIALLILIFWVKVDPEDAGFTPDNDESMTPEETAKFLAGMKAAAANSPWTSKHCLSTKEIWIMSLAMGVQLLFSTGVMSQMIPRLLELKFEQSQALNLMLFAALSACVGSWLMGIVDEKLGPRRAIQITYIIAMVALALNLTGNMICVLVSLVGVGVTVGAAANFSASIVASYWGRANFSRVYGVVQPLISLVGAFGPVYMAQVSANFGGYSTAYMGLIVMNLVALIVFSTVKDGSFVQKKEEQFALEK